MEALIVTIVVGVLSGILSNTLWAVAKFLFKAIKKICLFLPTPRRWVVED
jgi:hypothetical protein